MENLKELSKEILEKGYLVSLATLDEVGVWVADVIYIYDDDFNIYWMSDPDARHSRALLKNKKVAGTITISGQGEDNLGIQFEGVAERIEGPRFDLARKHFLKRRKPEPKETDDVLEGDFWYVVRPKKFELIYEKFFGFEKQILNF
jgi:uncharacterized protein YhbP (UPF0306 family)